MKIDQRRLLAALALTAGIAGCSTLPSSAQLDALSAQALKTSFRDEGIATMDRLVQDDSNRECSEAQAEGRAISPERAKAIEAANMKSIQWPSDGKYIGDWKAGEQIAQNGRGLTWTDDAKTPNGGNCYNCHQITKEEISFGTLGPSLYQYGKLRGVSNPASPESRAIVEYTWGKVWNAKAYNACSSMPRAGSAHILDEAQVRHVVALLLDPQSPVNR